MELLLIHRQIKGQKVRARCYIQLKQLDNSWINSTAVQQYNDTFQFVFVAVYVLSLFTKHV